MMARRTPRPAENPSPEQPRLRQWEPVATAAPRPRPAGRRQLDRNQNRHGPHERHRLAGRVG